VADFIEVIEGFNLTEALNNDSWTGTIVYKQVDDPSASMAGDLVAEAALPDVGDPWPAARDFGLAIPANLICRDISYDLEGGDFTLNNMRTFNFSTRDESSENQPDNNIDQESINISSFLRTITLSKAANAEKIKDAAGNVLELLTVREVQANYTFTEVGFATLQAAASSGSETGKVLTPNKNWLSLGTSVSQYEQENVKMFRASRSYSYKKLVSPQGRIDDDTWQADWFVKAAKFKTADGVNLYEEAATFVDTMPTIV